MTTTNPANARASAPQTRGRRRVLAAAAAFFAAVLAAALAAPAVAHAEAPGKGDRIEAASAAQSDRYDILRRGAVIISWGSGFEDVQTIQGGWLQMDGTVGHGELQVRDVNGQSKVHTITDAYPAMGGLGLELEVKSGGMFPQVVTLSTAAAGSPLYQGPDGGYEGDLEDWAGINDAEIMGLTFQQTG